MIRYYKRDGIPYPEGDVGLLAWADDFGNDKLKRVAYDLLPNGVEISTVWLGLDHQFGNGRPLIFETMLFVPQTKVQIIDGKVFHHTREEIGEQWRYSTEEEALRGHKMQVKKWRHFQTADQVLNSVSSKPCKPKNLG